jgi:hypothetical protein
MIRISGKIQGIPETISAISSIPGLLVQAGEGAMTECLELVSTTVRQDFLEGPYPEEIQSRSGSLRATFRRGHKDNIFRVESQGTKIIGTFGSTDKRARILNEGGVIRPRSSQFLAVRTDFTKTSGGVVREKYRGPLRGLSNTFVRPIRAPRAKAAVFEKIGKRIVPIAWLVRYVLIKGRHFMQHTAAKTEPQFEWIFQRRFQQVTDRLNQTLQRLRG